MFETLLGNIVNSLEGPGLPDGPWTGNGNTYVNGAFQQFAGFGNQYGTGEAGVLNYANQVVAANPNATFGQFYSSYVLGTGNPASLFSTDQLAAQYPTAYSNLMTNAGQYVNTPLSQMLGTTAGSGTGIQYPTGYDPTASGSSFDNSSLQYGGTTAIGDQTGDITGYSVAGVNAPLNSDSSNMSSLPNDPASIVSSGNLSSILGGATGVAGTVIPGNVTITDPTQIASQAGTAINTGVTGAANAITGTLASAANALEQYTSGAFVVIALVVLGIIFVAFGLGLFGKRELATI